jgi:hypothetical protein
MGKGSAPSAPDPQAVANAQEGVNAATIAQLTQANRVNTNDPLLGGSSWSVDPTTGQWTQTTNYSPITNQIQTNRLTGQGVASSNLSQAEQNMEQNAGTIGSALNTSGMPAIQTGAAANSGGIISNPNSGAGQGIQRSIASNAGDPALAQSQNAVYSQLTSRLNPQWSLAQEQLETQLTNQGIARGDPAWTQAMDEFNRQKTDAYNTAANTAVQTGNQLQSQMFTQGLQAGTFANNAESQAFSQLMTQAGFTNQAQQQQFMEQAQQAGMTNQAAAQMLQQMIAERMAPINEVNALTSGTQASSPLGPMNLNTGSQIQPPNMLGANQLGYQGALNQYNASVGQGNSTMGQLLQLGAMPMQGGGSLAGNAAKGAGNFLSSLAKAAPIAAMG